MGSVRATMTRLELGMAEGTVAERKRYEVEEVHRPRWINWTVVEYVDGVCGEGDKRWQTREAAEFAKKQYEAGRAVHGFASVAAMRAQRKSVV